MIEGVLFDLDGTLINSEPLWQKTEIEAFKEQGVELTEDDLKATKGLKSIEAVTFHHQKIENPQVSASELNAGIVARVIKLIEQNIELKEGAKTLLEMFYRKELPMAIASTAPFRLIQTAIETLGLKKYFKFLYSSDFEKFSKPHPAIYLSAAEKLNVNPLKTLAFEDSFNGILAAKSARLNTIALLDMGQINDTKYDFADMKIESFHNFGTSEFEYFNNIL